MPATFDKLGVRFQYPDNWLLDERDAVEERSVAVYSPEGALWSVTVHPAGAEPLTLSVEAVETMRAEYNDLDAESVSETIAGHDLVGFDMNFFYLDLTSTALVRAARTPTATLVIFCQAEDRDYARLELVFRAMLTSLLGGGGGGAGG